MSLKSGDGWNTVVLKSEKRVAGFVCGQLEKYLKHGVLFAVQELGGGQVVYFADDVMFRQF